MSAASTEEEFGPGLRWLVSLLDTTSSLSKTSANQANQSQWGGGLGVGMLGMWVIAQLWKDEDPKGKLLLDKVGHD